MGQQMIKKQEVELDLITLKTTKVPYSFKEGDTNVHEITLKLNVEEGFEFEKARIHYSNGDYQDIEGLTFIIKNSALETGGRNFEVEFISGTAVRRSGKVEYRVDRSINSEYEAYDKYNELKKLYDAYTDAVDNEAEREQLKVELIELKNSVESDLESISSAAHDIVDSENNRKQNEVIREQKKIELENLVTDIQNKLDNGDFIGKRGEPGPKGDPGEVDYTSLVLKADKTYVDSQDALKADKTYVDSKVQTDVPAGAVFTDTITTISGKTGAISKADIVALGIPAQDTVYTHPGSGTNPHGTTKSDVGLGNVTNDKQMPISGGALENYREKLVTLSGTSTTINLDNGNVFTHSLTGNTTYSITNAVSGQAHSFTLIINQTATVRTLTFPASVKWQGGEIPDMTTASKTYVLTFMTVDGGTTWLGMFGGEF